MDIAEKEKNSIFVKNYFYSFRIKRFLIFITFYIATMYLTVEMEKISIILVLTIIVVPFAFFIHPDHLRKETENAVRKFYNNNSVYDNKLAIICNLRKINGPTFGILQIDEKVIEFTPFRDNLQNERFIFEKKEVSNISLSRINSSILKKELNKVICIYFDSKKVLLQTPEPERTIEKICV